LCKHLRDDLAAQLSMTDRVLIVSATNVLARGFYAVPTDRLSERGEPVNALFAVTRAIAKAIAFKVPARAIAVVDTAAPRAEWPAILKAQVPGLAPLLQALGMHVVETADELHVVASYAQAALDAGHDVVIAGTDKRFAQLVGDRVWWYDPNKDARYTIEMVEKRFGVPPPKVGDWLALVGNPDDGIPGVAAIGAKGATTILATYDSVERALAALDSIGGRIGNALRAAKQTIPDELARTRLDRARALPVPLDALVYTRPDAAALNVMLKALGFLEYLASDDRDRVELVICETADAVTAALAAVGHGPIALHVLTEDPSPVRGALTGLALASGDRRAFYIPITAITPPLVAWLQDASVPKLGHDTKVAVVALRRRGIELAGIVGDTAIASHLAQPSNWAPHDLSIVAKHTIGRALPEEDTVRGVGRQRKAWAEVPIERAGDYAGFLADTAFAVWGVLAPGVDRTLHAEYLELSDTLVRMELVGVRVEADELARAEQAFAPIEAELEREITALAGHSFNLNSSKQLGQVLFEELKLPIVSHTKTGWSTATEALERIDHAHPIVALVIRWRGLRRLTDSWITALRACIDSDGRVHACFHPSRSFSGRIVNSNPDLGRVPGRTP
jgi:DNA polymerase-1